MAQGDLFANLMEGSGVWKEALDKNVISMERLKEIQEEIAEQQMDIYGTKRDMLKSDYKGANILKRMVSSGAKIAAQTEKVRKAKKNIADTEKDLVRIQKKIHEAQKLGRDSEASSLKKQYNAINIKNQKNKIGLKQVRQTIPLLGKMGAFGDAITDSIGGIVGAIPVIGSIISGLLTIGKTIIGLFLAPLKKAFGVFLEMQSAVGNLSADIGLTAVESKVLMKNMSGLALSAMKFGGNMKDVVTVMEQFSDVTGKNRMFSEGQMEKIIELGLGTGLGVEAASEMAGSFENMGISLEKTINLTDKARNLAARYNVNTTKVLKTYDSLVKSLTGIGFGKGLDNLTKLAAKATAIRFDIVGSTKAFADTFFDPEKAVEAAARMQVLGGKFAASFGDPMQLAFESMNNPEQLAMKFADAISEIAQKRADGTYFIPPAERKSLQLAAETLGQNYEEAVQTAIEQRKIADKMAMLQKSGFNLMQISEDDKPALANLISLNEKGQYVIKNSDGVDALLANMTDKNGLKAILDSRKKDADSALKRKNMMERIELVYDKFIMSFSDVFTSLFGGEDFDSFLKMVESAGTSLATFIKEKIMGSDGLAAGFEKLIGWAKEVFQKISGIWDGKGDFITNVGKTLKVLFTDVLIKVLETIIPFLKIGIATIMEGISHALPDSFGGKKMRDSATRMKQEAINSDKTGALAAIYNGSGIQQQILPPDDGTRKVGDGLMKGYLAGKGAINLAKVGGAKLAGKGLLAGGNALMGMAGPGMKVGKMANVGLHMAEAGAKIATKTASKSIPILGGLLSLGLAINDAMEGDWVGVGLKASSGVLNIAGSVLAPFSGGLSLGMNAAAIGIDVADAAREMDAFEDGQISINSNGRLYTGNFAKGDMVQFIHEKAYNDAMSSMGGGNGGGGSSSVVRHEGSIRIETQDGRYMTNDTFYGSADAIGARLAAVHETHKGGFGNYKNGVHDAITPIYA